MRISSTRWLAMALIAGVGGSVSSLALAHVDVGVNIGIPGVAYAPEPVYAAPPPVVYAPPPPVVVIAPGWYGERYYDGHRYWARRDWEERHHDDRDWREARNDHRGPREGWGHDHGGDGPRNDWNHGHDEGGRGNHGDH